RAGAGRGGALARPGRTGDGRAGSQAGDLAGAAGRGEAHPGAPAGRLNARSGRTALAGPPARSGRRPAGAADPAPAAAVGDPDRPAHVLRYRPGLGRTGRPGRRVLAGPARRPRRHPRAPAHRHRRAAAAAAAAAARPGLARGAGGRRQPLRRAGLARLGPGAVGTRGAGAFHRGHSQLGADAGPAAGLRPDGLALPAGGGRRAGRGRRARHAAGPGRRRRGGTAMSLWLGLLILLLLAALGMPLFAVIAGVALLGFHLAGYDLVVLAVELYRLGDLPGLVTIPLFALAGYLLGESGAPKRLVRLSNALLGWLPGGLAIVAIVACAFFTAFTGASGVTIVALGALLYPALRQAGYSERYSLGLVTAGGSLGLLFAPSLPLILYGFVAGQAAGGE